MTSPGHSTRASRPAWRTAVPGVVACAAVASSTELFLHLPKTGGVSMVHTAARAPGWFSVVMRASGSSAHPPCWCGTQGSPKCICGTVADPVAVGRAGATGRHLQVSVGHSTFGQAEWLRRRLVRAGNPAIRTVVAVRPVRDRLRSMFGFYWDALLEPWSDEHLATFSAVWHRVLADRRADARHYLRPDGSIDGAAWFRAFAIHTGGVNFFLTDVFGSPRALARALDRGLVAVPTSRIDAFATSHYGVEPHRANVTGLSLSHPLMVAALAEAEAEFEACARRDDPFDAVLADHLGDAAFRA